MLPVTSPQSNTLVWIVSHLRDDLPRNCCCGRGQSAHPTVGGVVQEVHCGIFSVHGATAYVCVCACVCIVHATEEQQTQRNGQESDTTRLREEHDHGEAQQVHRIHT